MLNNFKRLFQRSIVAIKDGAFFLRLYGYFLNKTGIKFFRWSVELMILGYAEKGD